MTDAERDALNAEYAVACKGLDLGAYATWAGHIDYLSSDAELGRRVKALAIRHDDSEIDIRDCGRKVGIDGHELFKGKDLEEATMRACIALKVPVPNA